MYGMRIRTNGIQVMLFALMLVRCNPIVAAEIGFLEGVLPKIEQDFYEQVLEPVLRDSQTPSAQYEALGQWLISESAANTPNRRVKLKFATYLFFGTTDNLRVDELYKVHTEHLQSNQSPVQQVLNRLPLKKGQQPRVELFAFTESEDLNSKKVYMYLTKKKFSYEELRWKLLKSSVQLIRSGEPESAGTHRANVQIRSDEHR